MPYSQRFPDALVYSSRVHADQVRKGTDTPYIIHLLAVAAIVGDYGGDEDQVIAALLHDAPEDQGGLEVLEHIRRRFGDTVAGIVEGCSDSFETPKPPWKARKEAYIAHIQHAPLTELLVSAADKLHNVRTILTAVRTSGDAVFERFKGGKAGTLWYYHVLVRAFEARATHPLFEELRRTVDELDRLASTPTSAGNGV